MIEYVLLIVIVISLSSVVYLWLKGYAPTNDDIECEDGVSIYISDINCTKSGENYTLMLSLRNTGRFNIRGFYIRGSNNTSQQIASIDLAKYSLHHEKNEVLFGDNITTKHTNSFGPLNEKTFIFYPRENLTRIEITPTRMEMIEDRNRLVGCQKAMISEKVSCP